MDTRQKLVYFITSVLTIVIQLDAVTVKPSLCPTNKIAPHRRSTDWEQNKSRTIGLIYSLLPPRPNFPRPPPINDFNELQEQLQEDDPDDCGDIEDYDETDLSSITPSNTQNYIYNKRGHRYFFNHNYVPSSYPVPSRPAYRPQRPSHKPQRPPYTTNKPTFSTGGVYGPHDYRPPYYSSSHTKPVHENSYDYPQQAYRPGLVGGTLGHVIGFLPVTPTVSDEEAPFQNGPDSVRFPDNDSYKRRPRSKQPNLTASIIGSFIDLLFN